MRRILGVLIAGLILGVALAVPAGAIEPTNTSGGARGNGIFAAAMSEGHNGVPGSYPDCEWKNLWRRSLWQRIVDRIRSIAAIIRQAPPGNFEAAELVVDPTDPETNLFADGLLAEILNRDPSTLVSYEGTDVEFIHKLILLFTGSEPVGQFRSIPDASDDLHEDPLFPQIQRGTYKTPSGDEEPLWWDPYYVTVDDPGPDGPVDCPPGIFYSPRNSDPVALVPDLQDYMFSLLPAVEPIVEPVDQHDGWAYVQVPVNFAVAAASLTEVSATAYVQDIDGGGPPVWAWATARPSSVLFLPGDGSPAVVCDLEDAVLPYDPADPGFCSHTYLDSSNTQPGRVYEAAIAVLWTGEFIDSNNGAGVSFPVPPTWATFDLSVGEARPAVSID